jgi:methionyl-tRNA formyltransferase
MLNRIVFFGNERLATGVTTTAPVLQTLISAGYEVTVVVAQQEESKSRKPRELEISLIAAQHNIPVLLPHKLSEIAEQLQSLQADIGVLVAFGKIVPQSLIDIFPRGIVNIHPSMLPKHRGPTPLESVILAGELETAVTLMSLGAKMDAGPIYVQQRVALGGNETKQQLADTLLPIGKDLVLQHLPAILDGSLAPSPQDDSAATYDQLITKEVAIIDWQQPAVQIERQIRAYAQWPKSRTTISGRDVVITHAHVIPGSGTPGAVWLQDREIGLYTAEGILIIDELVPAGKNAMSGRDFLLGYKPTAE